MSKRSRIDEFIDDSDDPEDTWAKTKKARKTTGGASAVATCDDMIKLSNRRYVKACVFNGTVLVDIREYWYDDSGVKKPKKKGISLTLEQWERLKDAISQIDERLVQLYTE